jgi:predicted transposase/invertase (TIGR01784 family)
MHKTKLHDKGYKAIFSNPLILKQLLESFVQMDWVHKIDFTKAEALNTTFIKDDLRHTEADLIYKLTLNQTDIYLYLLIEFQSTVDAFMALRMLRYVLEFYESLRKKDSALKKFPIVFPMLLYNGEKKWKAPVSIQDLIDKPKELGAVQPYIPHFQYFKIIENEFSEKTLLEIENIVSTMFLLETAGKGTFLRVIKIMNRRLRKEGPHTKKAFLIWLKNFLSKHVKNKKLNLKVKMDTIESITEGQSMFAKVLEEIEEEGYTKGIEKGIEKGRNEGREEGQQFLIKALLKNGADIDFIAKVTGHPVKLLKKMKE